ncbi:MAG TPA: GNAT family N-acetyltransferase [Solirubrobacteraceae bacterium]|nr:GNAT family N-acetyltransferase [Solirubrobacteraceae bacterium]
MALPIFTERLVLRPYVDDDLEQLHAVLYSDVDAMRLLGGPRDLSGTRFALERSMTQQDVSGFSFWPVIERESGLLVGEAGLFPLSPDGPDVALGYAFGARWWGRGYATEAARAVIAEAFGPLGMDRLVAITREANHGSRHVLEKLGFRMEGVRHVWGAEQLFFVLERDLERSLRGG